MYFYLSYLSTYLIYLSVYLLTYLNLSILHLSTYLHRLCGKVSSAPYQCLCACGRDRSALEPETQIIEFPTPDLLKPQAPKCRLEGLRRLSMWGLGYRYTPNIANHGLFKHPILKDL